MIAKRKIEQWKELGELIPLSLQLQVEDLIGNHLQHLADSFYREMLARFDSKFYLTNEEVINRLYGSMQAWIKELFMVSRRDSFAQLDNHLNEVDDVNMIHVC